MTLLFVSIGVLLVCLIGMFIFLGMWVYRDAKVKSTQPPGLWVLVVLLVPNFLGLIIYLLVGRTKKDVPAPGNFKRPAIVFALLFVLSIGFVVASAIRLPFVLEAGTASTSSGTFVGSRDSFRDGTWTYSARRANGFRRRSPVLTAEELTRFHVTGNSESGQVILTLQQNGLTESFNISNDFSDTMNLAELGFRPDERIRMTLDLDSAREVRVFVGWR